MARACRGTRDRSASQSSTQGPRIRLVREAGGLGDLVRLFSVCQGLKVKHPGCELHFYGLDHYRPLFRRGGPCPFVDEYFALPFTVSFRRPRMAPLDPAKWPYLDRGLHYDLEYDMFCPAFCWGEVDTDGAVVEDRGRIWCRAAEVEFSTPVWHVGEPEREWAADWLANKGLDPDKLVVTQPFGTTIVRNWPEAAWHELNRALIAEGWQVLNLDVCVRTKGLPGILEWRLSLTELGAVISLARLMVSGDSGLFHVAGAVGTRALGLFGLTSGEIMCRGYPTSLTHFIQGEQDGGCKPPCYGRLSRGWGQGCKDTGCRLLNAVPVRAVLEKALDVLASPRISSERRAVL
jgi:hypothetical protein